MGITKKTFKYFIETKKERRKIMSIHTYRFRESLIFYFPVDSWFRLPAFAPSNWIVAWNGSQALNKNEFLHNDTIKPILIIIKFDKNTADEFNWEVLRILRKSIPSRTQLSKERPPNPARTTAERKNYYRHVRAREPSTK